MNHNTNVKSDTMEAVDSWHFNKAQRNRKTTKIHEQLRAYLVK